MALLPNSPPGILRPPSFLHHPITGYSCSPISFGANWAQPSLISGSRGAVMCSSVVIGPSKKLVWVWTESREVMTAAVERGWNTFLFPTETRFRELANEWSSIALIHPLFLEGLEIVDEEKRRVATLYALSSPQELERLNPFETQADNVVINFKGEWQVIPAENLVAAFQGCSSTILAISTTSSEAQVFLEALEQGLGGVVLKVEDTEDIMKLKEYFDRRNESANQLSLTKARVTRIEQVGMGDRVCVDLCSLMQPGEGLLVGSFARGLFLVHSECLESNYIASRPFRVNAGPVHAYIAVPEGRTCYLSELHAGKEVTVVDQSGSQRAAIVGRVKIETRPLILVEAKIPEDWSRHQKNKFFSQIKYYYWEEPELFQLCSDQVIRRCVPEEEMETFCNSPMIMSVDATSGQRRLQPRFYNQDSTGQESYSIFLQNAETVGLICAFEGDKSGRTVIPVTSLKVGDEILLRLQGGARHTGIEIREFILEK